MSVLLLALALLWTALTAWAFVYTLAEWRQSRQYLQWARRPGRSHLAPYPKRDRDVAASLAVSAGVAVVIGATVTTRDALTLLAGELNGDISNVITRLLFIALAGGIANAARVQKRERNRRV